MRSFCVLSVLPCCVVCSGQAEDDLREAQREGNPEVLQKKLAYAPHSVTAILLSFLSAAHSLIAACLISFCLPGCLDSAESKRIDTLNAQRLQSCGQLAVRNAFRLPCVGTVLQLNAVLIVHNQDIIEKWTVFSEDREGGGAASVCLCV